MTLERRLEKVAFIVREMDLALAMADRAPTDFVARGLARHVLVRANDFVEHTAALLQPLREAGVDVSEFRSRRASYLQSFEEYFSTARTRLSAHVQDLEFIERLELWTDIEIAKVSYFAEGAREIYDQTLVPLYPGTPACPAFPELSDSAFVAELNALKAKRGPKPTQVTMASDMLAGARPQTVMMLNSTPTHTRASQLVGLDVWVRDELALLRVVGRYENAKRIILERLVTDVVSFADCLTTRSGGDPAQRITGLDDVLRACNDRGADPSAIQEFRAGSRFEERLEELRQVRNHLGAHVHEDDATPLQQLLQELDALDIRALVRFYDRLRQVFHLTCERTDFLGSHRISGMPLRGLLSTSGDSEYAKPFGQVAAPAAPANRPLSLQYDEQSMDHAIELWLNDTQQAEPARRYFQDAFTYSPVIEEVCVEEPQDGHLVPQPVKFRAAHAFLLDKLTASTNATESRRLLELVSECRAGSPGPLALMLHRLLAAQTERATEAVYDLLGALPLRESWPRSPLLSGVTAEEPRVAVAAAVGLYQQLMLEDRLATKQQEPRRNLPR